MKLGVTFPQNVIGGSPTIVRDFAQTAEGLGYSHLVAYDHVLGVNPAAYPDWAGPYTSKDLFHDPFTLFSYIAGITSRIGVGSDVDVESCGQALGRDDAHVATGTCGGAATTAAGATAPGAVPAAIA